MRTRLVRIACLFVSAASAGLLGLAPCAALALDEPSPTPATETPSQAPAASKPSQAPAAQKPSQAPTAKKPSKAPALEKPRVDRGSPPRVAAPRTNAKTSAQKKTKQPEPPPLPPAPARVWLIAPSPRGPWTLRIDNEGDRPMRIPADVRLLRFEIETGSKRTKKTYRCAAPAGLKPSGFPERRALLLPPGHSFIEQFDPRLLCFGKDAAALTGGAVVKAWYGWGPPPKWSKKPPSAPFAAESVDDPPAFAPAVGLAAPTVVLSHGAPKKDDATSAPTDGAEPPSPANDAPRAATDKAPQPVDDKASQAADDKAPQPADKAPQSADKAPSDTPDAPASAEAATPAQARSNLNPRSRYAPIVDATAPRLELTAEPWSDAWSHRSVVVRVTAKNAGRRPMTVAIRSRMLEFHIAGPNGATVCEASPPTGAIPREMFRTLKPGASTSVSVLVNEACLDNPFTREGLYKVTATLHANEPGTSVNLDAYTATVTAKSSTIVRVKSAPESFYTSAPWAVKTPKPEHGESPEHEDQD